MNGKIIIRLDEKLKQEAAKKAEGLGLNLSAYIRLLLSQEVNEK